MDDKIKTMYLALLKFSMVGKTSMKPNIILSAQEWHDLYRLVQQQATIGVCYKSLFLLVKEQMPPRTILLQWTAQVNYIQELNKRIEKVYYEIEGALSLLGISVAVMKGFSFACYYPSPALRMCGDLDLFIPDKYDAAIAYFKHQGYVLSESSQHVSLEYNGVRVELHHHIINLPFKATTHYSLVRKETALHTKYLTFDVEMQAVLLLTHAATHLAGPGISFRFLYDWAAFLQKHAEDLNTESFIAVIKHQHLSCFISVFTTAACELFGIEHPPFIPQNHSYLLRRLIKDMFKQGDCGQNERRTRIHFSMALSSLRGIFRLLQFIPYSVVLSFRIAKSKSPISY